MSGKIDGPGRHPGCSGFIGPRRECLGPLEMGDQGIEWCTVCKDCICCDLEDTVDHSKAPTRCLVYTHPYGDGTCLLAGSTGHTCEVKP